MDCLACGTPTRETRVGQSAFDQCPACGLARLRGYDGGPDYWDTRQAADPYWTAARRSYFRAALRHLPTGRLLDVGGGVGEFARVALEEGRDAYSLDSSETATGAAAETLGDRAIRTVPEGERFDVVTLWCVIAHVTDPTGLLEYAGRWLRPGGTLWLTTPNFAFQRRYGRILAAAGRPMSFADEDHLWHFTQASVALLLARSGFGTPRFLYVGGTDRCTTLANRRILIWGKRAWNTTAAAAEIIGARLPTSELQVVSRCGPEPLVPVPVVAAERRGRRPSCRMEHAEPSALHDRRRHDDAEVGPPP
jgi:SAM-dependent methyltransferase